MPLRLLLPPSLRSSLHGSRATPSTKTWARAQSSATPSYDKMSTVGTTDRLTRLRDLMKEHNVDVYNAHQSEYIAACDARRAFISGFTGSAGTAVITADKAALATDGRYFNQASKQLDSNWELLKQGLQDVPTWQDWTADQSEGNKVVGVDPTVVTSADARKLAEKIKKKGGRALTPISENLVDAVWGAAKPQRPNEKIKSLDVHYAGKKFDEKLTDLRAELEKKKSRGMIVSMLDEIAWLFNLRGNDIDYNPVFFAYALVTADTATLFVDESKLTDDVKSFLGEAVHIKPYHSIFGELAALKESAGATSGEAGPGTSVPKQKYLISSKASWALSEGLGGEENAEEVRSPIGDAKAVKNATELEGMRACHVRDGAALTEFFAWLENELNFKASTIDEVAAADKLEAIRSKHDRFVGLSFDTISSTGANAAVIHYKPEKGSCSVIDPAAIYLCDSGAQYLDGTTDTTRTLHFGTPTEAEREAYTLVLQGHIALEQIRFPKGVSGFALDTLARQYLWAQGLDYRHGTGHGVGSYLNVHEGPIGIGTRVQYSEVPLAVGNVISNEPGYYEDGSYGIRIENIIMVREVETKHKFGDKPFLGFEHVTMVPMCRKLIKEEWLSQSDKQWLNEYHAEVLEKTKSYFQNDELTLRWLERETTPFEIAS